MRLVRKRNMQFKKYQHLERWGTPEVQGIEFGECYVFPKIDGTNASIWINEDGCIQTGSRNRHLSLEKDNAGFYEWAKSQTDIKRFLSKHPDIRLFGEWLVPHSLETYKEDAWRNFYVFDVTEDIPDESIKHDSDDKFRYLHYNTYKPMLESYGISYIPPISIVRNGNYDQFIKQLEKNTYLIQDGKGTGEGIVLKNYYFVNKQGRTRWAKIVTSEFKERHAKVMGASVVEGKKNIEENIASKYVTQALCEKVMAKIENDGGFTSKQIPRLLNTVYYDVVKEESWNFVKENRNPIINYKTLQYFVFATVREKLPGVFSKTTPSSP